ncbi:MAG UNVERIFIED_CONTAM: hypothetical protein LVR29_20540 [Microcystis novacekii LVE1205-3]
MLGKETQESVVLFETEGLQDVRRSKEPVWQEEIIPPLQESDNDVPNNLDVTSDELMDLEELGELAREAVDQFQSFMGRRTSAGNRPTERT